MQVIKMVLSSQTLKLGDDEKRGGLKSKTNYDFDEQTTLNSRQ
jgi:hypothetical protein